MPAIAKKPTRWMFTKVLFAWWQAGMWGCDRHRLAMLQGIADLCEPFKAISEEERRKIRDRRMGRNA